MLFYLVAWLLFIPKKAEKVFFSPKKEIADTRHKGADLSRICSDFSCKTNIFHFWFTKLEIHSNVPLKLIYHDGWLVQQRKLCLLFKVFEKHVLTTLHQLWQVHCVFQFNLVHTITPHTEPGCTGISSQLCADLNSATVRILQQRHSFTTNTTVPLLHTDMVCVWVQKPCDSFGTLWLKVNHPLNWETVEKILHQRQNILAWLNRLANTLAKGGHTAKCNLPIQ